MEDELIVTDRKGSHKRRLFLYEEMILFSKQRRTKGARDVNDYKYGLKVRIAILHVHFRCVSVMRWFTDC